MNGSKDNNPGSIAIVSASWRKRRSLHVPIWTSVVLLSINITLLVVFIILSNDVVPALATGTIAISLGLFGLTFYLVLTIKEIRLNRRQSNFVDSVTHELKTPIASLKLYLETLQMRDLEMDQRLDFYRIMGTELSRLDRLINQMLEVARLDAIGQQTDPEDIAMDALLLRCAGHACAHHKVTIEDVFRFDVHPAVIRGRQMPLEMIFGNLMDNAVKYGGAEPRVEVEVRVKDRGRVITRIMDNGQGVPSELRKKVFTLFYRAGDELERSQKGTGLGLYIVRTLVHILKGKVSVQSRIGRSGSVFEVDLPGRASHETADC